MPEQNRTPTTHVRTSVRRQGVRLTKEQRAEAQEKFLKSFRNTANVRASCLSAGIDRNTVYTWLESDETFSLEYKQAELDANDTIRGELFRRAVQGYEKPVISVGKIVYVEEELPNGQKKLKPLMERVYSDHLLALLAKSRMQEFREKQQVELSGSATLKTVWGGGSLDDVEDEVKGGSSTSKTIE